MSRALLLILVAAVCAAAEAPEVQIANGHVRATILLPDVEKGYYQGTRFDWSGAIRSLRAHDHEYFGQWFDKYDPKIHDAIQGPVEEFMESLGYRDAKPGETFVRIGVGALRKPDEPEYRRFATYEIADPGQWTTETRQDSVTFTHVVRDHNGYAYRYVKTVRLVPGKAEMRIEHALKNTGRKRIDTQQYNHNFFVMDGQPTGPGARVRFGWDLEVVKPFQGNLARVDGREVSYLAEISKGQSAAAEFAGNPKYDLRVEHEKAGAGVRIRGDRPVSKVVYWSIRSTFCPEPYVRIQADPGEETRWNYIYEFYPL